MTKLLLTRTKRGLTDISAPVAALLNHALSLRKSHHSTSRLEFCGDPLEEPTIIKLHLRQNQVNIRTDLNPTSHTNPRMILKSSLRVLEH